MKIRTETTSMQINHRTIWIIVLECLILKMLCHQIYGAARKKNIYWLIKVKILLQALELWEMGEKRGTENILGTPRNPWGGNWSRTPFPKTKSALDLVVLNSFVKKSQILGFTPVLSGELGELGWFFFFEKILAILFIVI